MLCSERQVRVSEAEGIDGSNRLNRMRGARAGRITLGLSFDLTDCRSSRYSPVTDTILPILFILSRSSVKWSRPLRKDRVLPRRIVLLHDLAVRSMRDRAVGCVLKDVRFAHGAGSQVRSRAMRRER